MTGTPAGSGGVPEKASGRSAAPHPLAAALAAVSREWPRPQMDIGPPAPGYVPAAAIVADARMLGGLVARQGSGTLDRKAQAAFLTMRYASMVAITAVAPMVFARVVPTLAPETYALALVTRPVERDGETHEEPDPRVRFTAATFATDDEIIAAHPDGTRAASGEALAGTLREALETHFSPFVLALETLSGLSSGALWRLVGDSVGALFLEAGRRQGDEAAALAAGQLVLKATGSPLANPQMRYTRIEVRDPADPGRILGARTFRARGGCCRVYTVPGESLCSTCVLRSAEDQNRIVEARLRRDLGLPALAPGDPAA